MAIHCKIFFKRGYLDELIALAESIFRSPIMVMHQGEEMDCFSYKNRERIYPKNGNPETFFCRTLFPCVEDSFVDFTVFVKENQEGRDLYANGYQIQILSSMEDSSSGKSKNIFKPFIILARLYGLSTYSLWEDAHLCFFQTFDVSPCLGQLANITQSYVKKQYYRYIEEHCPSPSCEKIIRAYHKTQQFYAVYQNFRRKEEQAKEKNPTKFQRYLSDTLSEKIRKEEFLFYTKPEYENFLLLLSYELSDKEKPLSEFYREFGFSHPVHYCFVEYMEKIFPQNSYRKATDSTSF